MAGAIAFKFALDFDAVFARFVYPSKGHLLIFKCDQIRTVWAAGDKISALRIAARFFDRSDDTKTFKRGMDAFNNPGFYRQLGKDPEQITAQALARLAQKFALQASIADD